MGGGTTRTAALPGDNGRLTPGRGRPAANSGPSCAPALLRSCAPALLPASSPLPLVKSIGSLSPLALFPSPPPKPGSDSLPVAPMSGCSPLDTVIALLHRVHAAHRRGPGPPKPRHHRQLPCGEGGHSSFVLSRSSGATRRSRGSGPLSLIPGPFATFSGVRGSGQGSLLSGIGVCYGPVWTGAGCDALGRRHGADPLCNRSSTGQHPLLKPAPT